MISATFKLANNRIPEAIKNLRAGTEAVTRKNAQNLTEAIVRRTPRSDNDEPGHVHTQDTVHAEQARDGQYRVTAGGAMPYIEFGTEHEAALAPMRTSAEEIKPELVKDTKAIKVL